MPTMVKRKCKCCKAEFEARAVDVARGWGLFCSKRCKAVKQEAQTGQHKRRMGALRDDYAGDYPGQKTDGTPSKWDRGGYAGRQNDGSFVYVGGFGGWDDHKS